MDSECLMDSELIEMIYPIFYYFFICFLPFNLFCSYSLSSKNCGIVLIPIIWTFFSTLIAQVWLSVTLFHLEMSFITILSEQNKSTTIEYMYTCVLAQKVVAIVLYRKGHNLYNVLKRNNNG